MASHSQVKVVGEGSFSTVEHCLMDGKPVAVKRIKADLLHDAREVRGFMKEGIFIAKLQHKCAFEPQTQDGSMDPLQLSEL